MDQLQISNIGGKRESYKSIQMDGGTQNLDNSINGCSIVGVASAASEDDDFERISLAKYLKSIVIMPKSMRLLCLTNLITWMAHLCYCLYFTDFVGEAVFGGDPSVI